MFQHSIAVTVVHECEVVRKGLSAMIDPMPGMTVVREARSAQEMVPAPGTSTSVVLTSSRFVADVLEAAHEPAAWTRRPSVILVAASVIDFEVREALRSGVQGMLLLSAEENEIEDAIRLVAAGRRYLATAVAEKVAEQMDAETLTPREMQILQGLSAGRGNKAIALDMGIAVGTVKSHVRAILSKLDAASRTHAVVLATQRGLVRPSDPARPTARATSRSRVAAWRSASAAPAGLIHNLS